MLDYVHNVVVVFSIHFYIGLAEKQYYVNESYVTSQRFVNCFGSTTLHDKNFRPVQLSSLA